LEALHAHYRYSFESYVEQWVDYCLCSHYSLNTAYGSDPACQLALLPLAVQNMKAVKESDTDIPPEADEEAKEVIESKAESTSTSQPAAELEEELLQNPPKGSGDKLRVLRSRLKRLSGNISKNPQVTAKLSLCEI
jgi:hypothetical protein